MTHIIAKSQNNQIYYIPIYEMPPSRKFLPMIEILKYILDFFEYARNNPDEQFMVVSLGSTMSAGKRNSIIKCLKTGPKNCLINFEEIKKNEL